jgi:GR25 family glycosyltransferase involved in LPS biosynthesis
MIENLYTGFLNMDHRVDRLDHMNKQLANVGLEAVRHKGKKPQEYNLDDPKYRTMLNRTPGAIGCHEGQVEIMKTAQSIGANAMVLEDDVVFCSDFDERLSYMDEWTKTHSWDILWLGGTFHVPAFWHRVGVSGMPPNCSAQLGKDCESTDDERMIRTYGSFCTYAYIVNAKSIEKVLKMLEDFLPQTIGIDFSMIALSPKLETFAFVPGCCKQIDNISDIGTGMTVFSGFSKLNGTLENSRYWWQDKISDFEPSTFNFNQ